MAMAATPPPPPPIPPVPPTGVRGDPDLFQSRTTYRGHPNGGYASRTIGSSCSADDFRLISRKGNENGVGQGLTQRKVAWVLGNLHVFQISMRVGQKVTHHLTL